MARLSGRRVVITGASRGLGRAFAEACADSGARLVLNATSEERLAPVVDGLRARGAEVEAVVGSVAEDEVCAELVARCVARWGGIDAAIHNAGIVRDRTLLKMTPQEWDEVVAVHLRGAYSVSRHAAAAMRDGDGGQIVLIVSGSGLAGGFGQANYAAAKEGMMGLLRTSVLELTRFGVRCNAMWPVADTDMTQVVFERAGAAAQADGRDAPSPQALGFGAPEEVAAGLVWLLSDAAAELNGQCLSFNGRRVALWSHPQEHDIAFSDAPMTVEALDSWVSGATMQQIARPKLVP